MVSSPASYTSNTNEILIEGSACVKVIKLNRPEKFNAITFQMTLQLLKHFKEFELDPTVKLVILQGNGHIFSAGGDISDMVRYSIDGHWTFASQFDKKILQLKYMVATNKKTQVSLINGLTAGMGAGLCMLGEFRIVTEKAAFMMPEAAIGHFPDVGASYFLSRLPGFFGEYIGLTGARLDGADMLACGLGTHFIPSKNLLLLEEALLKVTTEHPTSISTIIHRYTLQPPVRKDSAYQRMDLINNCFSKGSVEEILNSLEHEAMKVKDKWISTAIKSIKMASPTCLKIFLRSIREGRHQDIADCLDREYRMSSHVLRGTVCRDFYEGVNAKLWNKDKKPEWKPSKLELVTEDIVEAYFIEPDEEEGWEYLRLSCRSLPRESPRAKL